MRLLVLLTLLLPAACQGDETVSAYGAGDRVWSLVEIDGTAFGDRATLTFPERGQMAGQAPCNRYSATMEAPYPWFEAGPIMATGMACPALDAEQRFLSTLATMTQSEVAGHTLLLSNESGHEMLFRSGE